MDPEYLIVGDGVAGSSAAKVLTEVAPDANVTIITAERETLYNRVLIKEMAKGNLPESAVNMHDVGWYEDRQIDLRLDTRVETVDVDGRVLRTEDGDRLSYEALLVATGGTPQSLPVENAGVDGIYKLWTIEQARRLRAEAGEAERGVVIGAGLLGLDMAAILAAHDVDAHYLMRGNRWWRYAMSEAGAEIIHDVLRDWGVEPVFGSGVDRFLATDGRVHGVRDTNGRVHDADIVTVAVGTEPNTGFLEDTAVALNDGVLVDEYMFSGVPGVYAAGDVARHHDLVLDDRVRNGSWDSAQQQGRIAGHNMLAPESEVFDHVPSYSVNHFEFPFLSFGHPTRGDEYVERTYDDREWRRLAFRNGRLIGGVLVGDLSPQRAYKQVIRSRTPVIDRADRLLARDVQPEEGILD